MPDPFHDLEFNFPPLADQVKKLLRQAILEGRLEPGDKLPTEDQLTERFGVSKTVVREALGHLVAEGLIEKRRGATGGSFVAQGDSNKILEVVEDCYRLGGLRVEEVIEFRRIMEPAVLELACLRRTEEDLAAMHQNLKETASALAQGRPDRDKQLEFHRLIADSCHNRFVSVIMNATTKISREFTVLLPFSVEDVLFDYECNQRSLECLTNRRQDEARKVMGEHFEGSRQLIEKYRRQQQLEESEVKPNK